MDKQFVNQCWVLQSQSNVGVEKAFRNCHTTISLCESKTNRAIDPRVSRKTTPLRICFWAISKGPLGTTLLRCVSTEKLKNALVLQSM